MKHLATISWWLTLPLVIFVGFAWAMGGCTSTKYMVSVSAIASPEAENAKSYVLIPDSSEISSDNLQFQEFAVYLNRALVMDDFLRADNINHADFVILVGYTISSPVEHLQNRSIPQYGRIGKDKYNRSIYGTTGYSTRIGTYYTYMRNLDLLAVDAKTYLLTGKIRELWRVSAASTGYSDDLRLVFPYIVTAAQPYLGKSTDKHAITIEFKEDSAEVIRIRDGVTKK